MKKTRPIGKVKIISKGVEPMAVLSFSASSRKIDATRLKSKGENPKITPPSTSGDLRAFCPECGGGGGGEGNVFSPDIKLT